MSGSLAIVRLLKVTYLEILVFPAVKIGLLFQMNPTVRFEEQSDKAFSGVVPTTQIQKLLKIAEINCIIKSYAFSIASPQYIVNKKDVFFRHLGVDLATV